MSVIVEFIGDWQKGSLILVAVLPSIALMLVNGWTDAPVGIATAVCSGALKFKTAVFLAAVCNFFGAALMTLFGSSVAVSIFSISGIGVIPTDSAGNVLISAMLSVVVWSLFALYFCIPTSESHALSAALFGASAAVIGSKAFFGDEWLKIALGVFISAVPTLMLSALLSDFLLKKTRKSSENNFKKLQILGAAATSFAHGAQDGQKFAAVVAVTIAVCNGSTQKTFYLPAYSVLLSAAVISLGMLMGGKRILKGLSSFAADRASSGFAADVVSAVSLLVMSLLGIPASTTHAKTCALMGASIGQKKGMAVGTSVIKLTLFWILTFPVCFLLGFIISHIIRFVTAF